MSTTQGTPIANCGPAESVRFDLGGYQVYLVLVSLGEAGLFGITLFAHPKVFDKARPDQMCAEAVQVVLDTRLIPRRQEIVQNHQPVSDPQKFNEECFRQDIDLFNSVMHDTFGFNHVMPGMCHVTIEPTVKRHVTRRA